MCDHSSLYLDIFLDHGTGVEPKEGTAVGLNGGGNGQSSWLLRELE